MKIYVVMIYDILDLGDLGGAFLSQNRAKARKLEVEEWEDVAYAVIHEFDVEEPISHEETKE